LDALPALLVHAAVTSGRSATATTAIDRACRVRRGVIVE
jgi:hypothetical protein